MYWELCGPGFVRAVELQDETDADPGLLELAVLWEKTGIGHLHRHILVQLHTEGVF